MAITLDGTVGVTSPDFIPSSSNIPTNGLFLPAANTVGLATGSTERLRIDSSGNLGLGVTPAGWSLSGLNAVQVKNGSFAGYNNVCYVSSNAYYNSGWKYIASDFATQYDTYNGQHRFFNAPSGTAGAAISFTQAMTLDASGNLGIGTSSPGAKLHAYTTSGGISAQIETTASDQAGLNLFNSTRKFRIIADGSASALVIYDQTAGSERARIDSSGNLLVGMTSVGATSSATIQAGYISQIFNLTSANQVSIWNNNNATGTTYSLEFRQNNVAKGSISVSSTATTYNTLSDQRLKENIVDAPNALSSVNAIKVRSFDWKSDGSHVDYGYIAQELLEVVPEAVSVPSDPDEMMGVDFGKLTPRIIKALQELTARLEALEAK